MAARTGRPYKLQVLSTNGERKLQGSANNPTVPRTDVAGASGMPHRTVHTGRHRDKARPSSIECMLFDTLHRGLGARNRHATAVRVGFFPRVFPPHVAEAPALSRDGREPHLLTSISTPPS